MDTPEVVMHVVQRHRIGMILRFLGEAIGEAGEPPHAHAHGEVLALGVARGDVRRVRDALDIAGLCSNTFWRAVAGRIVPRHDHTA